LIRSFRAPIGFSAIPVVSCSLTTTMSGNKLPFPTPRPVRGPEQSLADFDREYAAWVTNAEQWDRYEQLRADALEAAARRQRELDDAAAAAAAGVEDFESSDPDAEAVTTAEILPVDPARDDPEPVTPGSPTASASAALDSATPPVTTASSQDADGESDADMNLASSGTAIGNPVGDTPIDTAALASGPDPVAPVAPGLTRPRPRPRVNTTTTAPPDTPANLDPASLQSYSPGAENTSTPEVVPGRSTSNDLAPPTRRTRASTRAGTQAQPAVRGSTTTTTTTPREDPEVQEIQAIGSAPGDKSGLKMTPFGRETFARAPQDVCDRCRGRADRQVRDGVRPDDCTNSRTPTCRYCQDSKVKCKIRGVDVLQVLHRRSVAAPKKPQVVVEVKKRKRSPEPKPARRVKATTTPSRSASEASSVPMTDARDLEIARLQGKVEVLLRLLQGSGGFSVANSSAIFQALTEDPLPTGPVASKSSSPLPMFNADNLVCYVGGSRPRARRAPSRVATPVPSDGESIEIVDKSDEDYEDEEDAVPDPADRKGKKAAGRRK
jgi:hypothetical protein